MKRWIEKRPEVRKFQKWEASWLAGVIDGEGSIGLYDYGREGRRVCIQMANTDKEFVARMREVIGCGSSIMRVGGRIRGHIGSRQMFMFSLKGSNRCYWVLKQILPFLIIKKEKALGILKALEEKPFGRWANATPEYRKSNSERLKREWQNPVIRRRRLEGIRKHYASQAIK